MRIPYLPNRSTIRRNKGTVALLFSVLCACLSLPWTGTINSLSETEFFGIAVGYFFSLFVGPVICLILISIFIGVAEDIDRHDPELENE